MVREVGDKKPNLATEMCLRLSTAAVQLCFRRRSNRVYIGKPPARPFCLTGKDFDIFISELDRTIARPSGWPVFFWRGRHPKRTASTGVTVKTHFQRVVLTFVYLMIYN